MDATRSTPLTGLSLEAGCTLTGAREISRQARAFLSQAGIEPGEADAWELALTEAANNAVRHCAGGAIGRPIRIELLVAPDRIEARVTDHTDGFDLPARVELPPEDSESGRGLFLIQSLTDEAVYLRGATENCLVLRRRRAAAGPVPATPESPSELKRTLDLMTEELASSYESLAAIFRFSAELGGSVDSATFAKRWLDELLAITDSDWFVLRLNQPARNRLETAATSATGLQAGPLLLDDAAGDAAALETTAALGRVDAWFDCRTPVAPEDPLASIAGAGCGFAHPLVVGDTLVGVFTIGRRDGARPYPSGQVSVIQTLTDFLAIQIRSTQIQEEQVRVRINTRELEIAAGIQRALLPERLPSLPRNGLAAFYRSAREIGGDYYDALPVKEGGVLLVIADVMGKGLPAALFAFMFRSLVRSQRDLASRPGEFLAWLNRNLFQELDRAEMFIAAQIAYLDTTLGNVTVAAAGHPPLLIASSTGEVTEIAPDGPPLGVVADASYAEHRHAIAGCHALMATDGLLETRNPGAQLLGLDAIKSTLGAAARRRDSCEDTRLALTRLFQSFEQGTAPADDTAFIVITDTTPTPTPNAPEDPHRR